MNPSPASMRRKAARNRLLLEERQKDVSCTCLAEKHRLSVGRVHQLIKLEAARVAREVELALADRLPVQPNPLHLTARTRAMVAEALRRGDFTREDVVTAGPAVLLRVPGMNGRASREVEGWLQRSA